MQAAGGLKINGTAIITQAACNDLSGDRHSHWYSAGAAALFFRAL
jgi:hypothetical protein